LKEFSPSLAVKLDVCEWLFFLAYFL